MESSTWTQKPNGSWRGYILFKKGDEIRETESEVAFAWYNPFTWL